MDAMGRLYLILLLIAFASSTSLGDEPAGGNPGLWLLPNPQEEYPVRTAGGFEIPASMPQIRQVSTIMVAVDRNNRFDQIDDLMRRVEE